MYIASAEYVKKNRDMIHAPKRLITPEEARQRKAEAAHAKEAAHVGESGADSANLTISENGRRLSEGKSLAEEEAFLKKMYEEQAESAKKSAEGMKDMGKLLEIARRIANGDTVPPEDEKKLMEFNPKLYQAAKAAAVLNADKKHKKYDSLFEEESDDDKREKLRELEREGAEETFTAATTEVETVEVAEGD